MADERRRILVVEDSPMMSRMYRMVLGDAHTLRFAADGVEGLDEAARDPGIDLLLVDINMPRMDGLEFLRRLRDELGLTRIPVLVCSTESAPGDEAAARAAGATAFLAKPWTPAQLREAVGALLGHSG